MIKRISVALVSLLAIGLGVAVPAQAVAVAGTSSASATLAPPAPTKLDKPYRATKRDKSAPKGGPSEFRTFACPCYDWVGARQQLAAGQNATSFALNLHIENAYLERTTAPIDYHTLGQLHLKNTAGDEAVEYGWGINPGVFGDLQPRIFAGVRKNGVWQGYGTGFVDYAPTTTYTYGSVVPTGTPKRFQIALSGTSWWLAYDGVWIGYFPASAFAPDTFTTGDFFQGFYEVASRREHSCSDMATGLLASSGTAARVGSISLTGGTSPTTSVTAFSEPAGNIGYTVTALSVDTVRGSGPGANAAGTATGITGGC